MAIKKYINTTEAVELTGHLRNEIINLAKTGVLPSHRTRRGHYRLNVDAVEAYFGIQINKPTEEVDKPKPIVKPRVLKVEPRAPKVKPRYVEVVAKPMPVVKYATSSGTRLIINESHYQEVLPMICAAKSSIRIMTANFQLFKLKSVTKQGKNYKSGTPFIKYLMEKAEQGVSVQIILSDPTKNVDAELKEYFRQLKPYPFCTRNCRRNHAKVAIIDNKIAYIGSANATRAGFGQHTPGNFEAGILTENPEVVSSVKDFFKRIWDGEYCEGCHRKKECTEY